MRNCKIVFRIALLLVLVCFLQGLFLPGALSEDISTGKNIIEFSAGSEYCLAIRSDGTLWGWGNNRNGQLGDGTYQIRTRPVQIGKDKDWKKTCAGFHSSYAIKSDGSLWAWGDNGCGQLGDGTVTNCPVPTRINNKYRFVKVETGEGYMFALADTGSLWVSGNIFNKAPTKGNYQKARLRQIGSTGDWADVSASTSHVLALKKDGSIWSGGANGNGQLGNGVKGNSLQTLVQTGTGTDWIKISAGEAYSLAQKKDGSLWRWGLDHSGTSITFPKQVGTATDWMGFSAYNCTVAVKTDGTLWTWGKELGDLIYDSANMTDTEPDRVGEDNDWCNVQTGFSYCVALKKDGTLYSWGYSSKGQIGNGTIINMDNPVPVDGATDWAQVSAGEFHTLAVKADGSLWAWGNNCTGACGISPYLLNADGTDNWDIKTPLRVGTGNYWRKAISATAASYALKKDGSLWAFGDNQLMEFGNGGCEKSAEPVRIGGEAVWDDIRPAGISMAVGLKSDGTIWIWGTSYENNGSNTKMPYPKQVGYANDWAKVWSGRSLGNRAYIHAIKKDGSLWSLGYSDNRREDFFRIANDSVWVDVVGYQNSIVGLKKDHTLWKWNLISDFGNNVSYPSPTQIGTARDWETICGYSQHVLAIKTDGSLWGFGGNTHSEVTGTKGKTWGPVRIGEDCDWKQVSPGFYYSTAIKKDGSIYVWGDNHQFQLGIENTSYQPLPCKILFDSVP